MQIEKTATEKQIYVNGKLYNSRKICLEDLSEFSSLLRKNRIKDALKACEESGIQYDPYRIVKEFSAEVAHHEAEAQLATMEGIVFLASRLIEGYEPGMINEDNMGEIMYGWGWGKVE